MYNLFVTSRNYGFIVLEVINANSIFSPYFLKLVKYFKKWMKTGEIPEEIDHICASMIYAGSKYINYINWSQNKIGNSFDFLCYYKICIEINYSKSKLFYNVRKFILSFILNIIIFFI